jgi:hypothetical protein
MTRRQRLLFTGLAFVACLAWASCLIIEIEMPSTANPGEVITLRIVVQEDQAEGATPWKGVLSVLVPEDWTYVGGTFSASDVNGSVGSGTLEPAANWADSSELAVPAPVGMNWVGTISDMGFLHAETLIAEAEVQFEVGPTLGTFPIGYIVTKEAYFPSLGDWFGPNLNGADSTMKQMIEVVSATAIEDVLVDGIPTESVLDQNYPNPFNPSTTIRFALKEPAPVSLTVFDVQGRQVAELVNRQMGIGIHEVDFGANDLPSGVYLYRLEAGEFVKMRSMVLTK